MFETNTTILSWPPYSKNTSNEIIYTRLVYALVYPYLLGYLLFFLSFFVQKNSNGLLDREDIELIWIPSTSQGNSKAATILESTENIVDGGDDDDDDNDDDGKDENSNDLLDQKSTHLMPVPSTSQGDSSTAAITISTENIDDDDTEEDYYRNQERMELMPSTSQGNSKASAISKSTENNDDDDDDDDDDDEEGDSFATQRLFSFAWQIAKGMVGINIAISE